MPKENLGLDDTYYDFALLLEKDLHYSGFKISIDFIITWIDFSKYLGEDESGMLDILNKMKKNYFKNPLGKDLMFYIAG